LSWENPNVSDFFTQKYNWDILAATSVWAFGPDDTGPNLLLDYSLPGETDKSALSMLQDSVVQGFQWACREGPLCEEPLRGVKFKILQADVASDAFGRAPGQIIPTTRRTCYSAYLMANPRLLEPQLMTEIQCTEDSLTAVYGIINKRRGHLVKEIAKPGTPLYTVRATIPALDSFGFETDIRSHTIGQAFPLSSFDTWALLPGDPLDKSIKLTPLEPAPPSSLGREILLKTRRRKGLNEEVSILNYFDDPNVLELLRREQAALLNTKTN
jgi:116 kDa U5 small nuclear ribonucleoprotein component